MSENIIYGDVSSKFLYLKMGVIDSISANEDLLVANQINPIFYYEYGNINKSKPHITVDSKKDFGIENIGYLILDQVLNRLEDPLGFLKNIHNVLPENCVVLICVPDFNNIQSIENESIDRQGKWFFDAGALRRIMQLNGWRNVKIDSIKRGGSKFIRAVGLKKNRIAATQVLDVIMPVYNEGQYVNDAIEQVLNKKVEGLEIHLIIVESNSTDGTRNHVLKYLDDPRVTLILQNEAKGKGNAVREGFKHITGDFVLIQDADNEYDIEDYDSLLRPLMRSEVAFVLGARHGGKAWKMRHFEDQQITSHFLNFGHVLFTFLVNVFYGLKLKDPFTMYKLFRSDCLDGIQFESNRFDFDYELLIKLTQAGYIPIEIPVNYRSRSFVEGKKVRMIRDPLTWLWAIIRFKF